MSPITSDCSCQLPLLSLFPRMELFLNHWVALLWKNLELLSLFFNHNTFDLWFHIQVSLSTRTWISALNSLSQELSPLLIASASTLANNFFLLQFSPNIPKLFFPTIPNPYYIFQFFSWYLLPHHSSMLPPQFHHSENQITISPQSEILSSWVEPPTLKDW